METAIIFLMSETHIPVLNVILALPHSVPISIMYPIYHAMGFACGISGGWTYGIVGMCTSISYTFAFLTYCASLALFVCPVQASLAPAGPSQQQRTSKGSFSSPLASSRHSVLNS